MSLKAVDHLEPGVVTIRCTECQRQIVCELDKYLDCTNAKYYTNLDIQLILRNSRAAREALCMKCFAVTANGHLYMPCTGCCKCATCRTPTRQRPTPIPMFSSVRSAGSAFDYPPTPSVFDETQSMRLDSDASEPSTPSRRVRVGRGRVGSSLPKLMFSAEDET